MACSKVNPHEFVRYLTVKDDDDNDGDADLGGADTERVVAGDSECVVVVVIDVCNFGVVLSSLIKWFGK